MGEISLPITEYKKQRVITLNMMDEVHQRVDGTARRNFNKNKSRLIAGEDYFDIRQANEIRTLGFARNDGSVPEKIILLTETGYLMLVKSFTDELAWKVQRELVSHYFRVQQEAMVTSSNQLGGIVKGIVNKSLLPIKEQFETQIKALCEEIRFLKSSYDPSGAFVTDYKPIVEFLKDMKIPQKGRRRLVYKCTHRCRRYLLSVGKGNLVRPSRETGRWLYHVDGVNEWLKYEGHAVIAFHMDKLIGQGRLQLVSQF
ncbi:ORF6N domain-containing protein [Commensalibacter papalotli (ex Servin-Garciduenas et al. 2014)]|uniref:ORF6N domain-containing protein n=1 Tax=Commensalibacter papalotli (ex Servin-Garciduenas et al. 2014) TaxID=1208583 RepID=UPI00190F616D|nr:ORF6N domain-containing protein [Commensalibacter papalotli (ex Servin-Garciduenas et al. 2014)]